MCIYNKTLHVETCAIHHKETLSILTTKIVTNFANYVNHIHYTILYCTILYYTILYYTILY